MRRNVHFTLSLLATMLAACSADGDRDEATMTGGRWPALMDAECESHPDGTATCGPYAEGEATFSCKIAEDRAVICWSLPDRKDGDGECRDLTDGRHVCGYFLDDGVIAVCKIQDGGTVLCGQLAAKPGAGTWQSCDLDEASACRGGSTCVPGENEPSRKGVCIFEQP